MELKRYVMLKNNKIYDLQNEKDIKAYETVKNSSHSDFQVKSTSDNILDMIWDNDLLDLDGEIVHVFGIDKETGGYVLMNTDMIIKNSCNITAIYKRQSNGDYKRYEVKEWLN